MTIIFFSGKNVYKCTKCRYKQVGCLQQKVIKQIIYISYTNKTYIGPIGNVWHNMVNEWNSQCNNDDKLTLSVDTATCKMKIYIDISKTKFVNYL